jgi:hypothetical protein
MPMIFYKALPALACAALLAACQTAQNPRAEEHLSKRWEGKPVQAFESRFGAPASRSAAGSRTKLVWTTTREEVTPAHERSFGFGVSGVAIGSPLKSEVAATSQRKSCTVEVTAENGTIAHIDIIKDDSTRESASLCLLSFG